MLTIAVDGYASTGKGVICTKLAQRLGIVHFDTGAIYRAIAVYVIDNNINPRDEQQVTSALKDVKVTLDHHNGEQITFLNGEDISTRIRNKSVSNICSIVSPYIECREFVLNIQRESAKKYDLIMEGRDITSHVLPDATFKFFLDASIDVRAKRRYKDFIENGENVTIESVKAELIERDKRDTFRQLSPLILTEGTIHIDNSNMTIVEEVDLMYKTIMGEIKL